MSRTVKTVIAVVLVAVLGIGLYFLITSQINATKERTFSEFRDLIEVKEGEVQTDNSEPPIKMIYISGYTIYGYTTTNTNSQYSYWTHGPSFYDGYDPDGLLETW